MTMDQKLWQFSNELSQPKMPYDILKKYAIKLQEDTEGMFNGDVSQIVNDDYSVIVSFYIIVPGLRNYGYKLMQMKSKSFDMPYPAEMQLIGTAEGNVIKEEATNQIDFESKVEQFIVHPLTKHILYALKIQIDIYKDSRFGE